MKIAKLFNATDKVRRINARFVRVIGYKAGRDKKGFATAIAKTYTPQEFKGGRVVPSADKNKYVSSIKFLDEKLNVKVSCSCPDFCFRWEYNNHKAGAADIIYSNGEPPTVMGTSIGLCKHLVALRLLIKNKHGV